MALFDAEYATSRGILAECDPDAMAPYGDKELAIRDVVDHMIEETARHAGHMDILREQDGHTGGFPPGGLPWS